jgi:hypothetical protein
MIFPAALVSFGDRLKFRGDPCRVPAMRALLQLSLGLALAVASGLPVSAQPSGCAVTHKAFVEGGVAQGQMRLANNGNACEFSFKFGQTFDPSDWKIESAPKHGRLEVGGSSLKYLPDAGYAGPDAFTVAVFGYNPMLAHGRRSRDGRFAFNVDVRPVR